jgi:hypothetical protein
MSERIHEIYEYDIKVIAGPLLVNWYLPTSCWGQVYTPDLRLTAYPPYAFSMWESKKISYLRKIEVRCTRTNLTTIAYIDGYTQKTRINVRFQSPSIVKYLDLLWRI